MDQNTAQGIVVLTTAVGVVAWLAGVTVMLRTTRARHARALEALERFDVEAGAAESMVVGESEVEGQPEQLATKITGLLARDAMGPLGPVKIVSCDRKEVVFEPAGHVNNGMGGFTQGRIRLTPISGSRTRVAYAIETSSGKIMLMLGWMAIGLGLIAIVVGCWLMFHYVLPDPRLCGQSVQMVQIVHFLWPPFLFAALAGQAPKFLRARMETLVHNLPYTA